MTVNIHQTVINVLTETREPISTRTFEAYVIYPEINKILRNKKTGLIVENFISLNDKDLIADYEEINKPCN